MVPAFSRQTQLCSANISRSDQYPARRCVCANISPGMAVTVDIKTGNRTILSYLLSPLLKYGHDMLRER
jgi:hypothetical protein